MEGLDDPPILTVEEQAQEAFLFGKAFYYTAPVIQLNHSIGVPLPFEWGLDSETYVDVLLYAFKDGNKKKPYRFVKKIYKRGLGSQSVIIPGIFRFKIGDLVSFRILDLGVDYMGPTGRQ